jgi:hypothetical protein
MDRIADLVRQLEPEMALPPLDVQARQHEALLQSMPPAERLCTPPPRWRRAHKGWFVVIGAAAAAVVASIWVPGSSPSSRAGPSTSAVLTAVTRALATAGGDIEEVQSRLPGAPASTTSWVDLSTGACRTDTSLDGEPAFTIFLNHGKAVFVDYGLREWWIRNAGGVGCEPPTPRTIEHDVTTGDYTVAGRAVVEGQPALKLVSTSTTTGLHQETKLTTLWVNARTYLPIQATSSDHLIEQTTFTWLPATTNNTAILSAEVPGGFRRVAPPPPKIQAGE